MASLPDYVAATKPVPLDARVAWYSGIAPTYAGVMVWFAFWQQIPGFGGGPGGMLAAGIIPALIAVVLSAAIIHFLFYVVPGLMGKRTGLPLYVVGTSTYGVTGGLFMPGFLMGILQFFWLGFNAFFVSDILCRCFGIGQVAGTTAVPGATHGAIAVVFAVFAAFMGLKGIQYVAKVATFLPIIPIVVLLILLVSTIGGLAAFSGDKMVDASRTGAAAKLADAKADLASAADEDAEKAKVAVGAAEKAVKAAAAEPAGAIAVIIAIVTCIVGFFATAGAAGVDISMNAKEDKDVHTGGMVGIAIATVFSAGLAVLIVAGTYGGAEDPAALGGQLNPVYLMQGTILGEGMGNFLFILLAISSFPAACFSALIAANSFRTTMPNVNPFVSVGIGTLGACVLAVTGAAGNVAGIFAVIGATFGPVCGAMCAEFLLNGGKWPGPRAGMNPAGWISWIIGTVVGAWDLFAMIPGLEHLSGKIPSPVMLAFIVGFVLYFILAKAGLESKTLEMPGASKSA
jgi:cytosine permease